MRVLFDKIDSRKLDNFIVKCELNADAPFLSVV